MSRAPKRDLKRQQRRRRKLRHLHRQLEETTDPNERRRLIVKIRRVSPKSPVPDR